MPLMDVRVEELTFSMDPLLVICPPLLWNPMLFAQTDRGQARSTMLNSLAGVLIMNSSVRGPEARMSTKVDALRL